MADLVFNMGGVTRTHTLTAAHQQRLLDCYKAKMVADWPLDGEGNPTEPSNAQIAAWVAEKYIIDVMKRDVLSHERNVAIKAASAGVTELGSVVS